ncbi:MAG: RluA family pseudouridine synthase [Bacteroidales bacterium]|jgi:23S rRNA pseudouridine1911/1915/1917 synthase|nr:RluA family pseudouridine synthase [Bacteroidales bacterium]MDD2204844.1 RluA family pseudouridine synthase [Bacteroidales bacterium]MDD3914330.1 RluA family pseudouridine synthase [Bacteroidales bacterium]MDD4634121.1 RluA family pseudouridine synthase [Bacteroidales bacterium]
MNKKQAPLILKVSEEAELLTFLRDKLKDRSNNEIKSILTHKRVVVNGSKTVTRYNYKLKPDDDVSILPSSTKHLEFYHPKLQVVFEDDYIVVVSKKEGLLSIGTEKEREETAYFVLNAYYKYLDENNHIYVVHRLDKDTSGVMVFAKSEDIQEKLQSNWNEVVVERTYVAVVEGVPDKKQDTVVSYLQEDKFKFMHSHKAPSKEGKQAITTFKVLRYGKYYSLLELNLETGRKNQIRVHLQSIGHPIVGDKRYGSKVNPIGRLCLHANTLSFIHPVTGKVVKFEVPVPRKMLELVKS